MTVFLKLYLHSISCQEGDWGGYPEDGGSHGEGDVDDDDVVDDVDAADDNVDGMSEAGVGDADDETAGDYDCDVGDGGIGGDTGVGDGGYTGVVQEWTVYVVALTVYSDVCEQALALYSDVL